MVYTLNLQRRAYADIDAAFKWIEEISGLTSATRWRNGLIKKSVILTLHPERFQEAHEASDVGLDLRELLYGKRPHVYRILFTIDGEVVNIHRVRHASRDWVGAADL